MGNFEFASFDNTMMVKSYVGKIYMVVFIVITNITLLNFVIAILSNTYEILTNLSSAVFLRHIVVMK